MEVYIAQKNAWNKEFHVYGVSFEFYVHIEYSNFNLNFNLDRAVTSDANFQKYDHLYCI